MASKSARVPRLVAGVDLTDLPLSPLEGFVLSRIDGAASLAVLADLTNLEEEDVSRIVDKLIELGAAEWARETVSLPRATGRTATRTPAGPVQVPESLRAPPARSSRPPPRGGTVRMRPRSDRAPSSGVYRGESSAEERVDPSRRSVHPESAPRASHTGSIFPAGEVQDESGAGGASELELGTADTMPPPAADEPQGTAGDTVDTPKEAPRDATADASAVETTDDDAGPPDDPPVDPSQAFAAEAESLLAEAAALLGDDGAPEASDAPAQLIPEPEEAPAEPEAQLIPEPEEDEVEAEAAEASAPDAAREEEAEEELDLDPARRKRIDDLYFALDLLDHYQVLGVERDVEKKEIRSAYFQLSKVFHPDTMFRKRLGSYKAKMEAIFNRLTEAYEVLGRKRSRREYDQYLASQDRTRAAEAVMEAPEQESEVEELERLGEAAAQLEADLAAGRTPGAEEPAPSKEEAKPAQPAAQPARSEPAGPAAARSRMSEAGRRRARELMAKKLRHAARASSGGRSAKAAPPDPAPSAPPAKADRKQVLRSLASSLRATAGHTGGLDQVKRHEMTAARAEKEGDLAEAAQALRLALMMAPEREDLRERHARLNAELAASLSASYEEQARYEQRHGKWGAAALSWAKVFEGRPSDARAARFAAEALVEAKGDLHRARDLAQKAADLAPDDVENLRALAKVYIAAGLPLNARRVLQRAAKLDPSDEMVENLLRELESA
jgi:curved DNA-binding protein CbpA